MMKSIDSGYVISRYANLACKSTANWARGWLAHVAIGLVVGLLPAIAAEAALDVRVVADRAPLDTTPIQAYVTVTDASTGLVPVTGLTLANFSLLEDGSAQSITGLTLPAISGSAVVSLVFVMDYSVSVSAYATDIEAAVVDMINNHMQADDLGAIVKFNSVVSPLNPAGFSADKTVLENAAHASITPSSGTALYDAVMTALVGIDNASLPAGPRAVILLSDGRENGSVATLDETLAQINSTSVPIFAIVFNNTTTTTRLSKLVDASHGQITTAANSGELQGIYQTIVDQLQNEYLLTYSSAILDNNPHTLVVGVDSPDAQTSSPTTFYRSTASNNLTSGGGGGGGLAPIECLVLIGFCAVILHRCRRADRQLCRVVNGAE